MKNLTQLLLALFCLCLPTMLYADRDDSKYLAGAVPEVDGKVVFSKEFSIPGMSQEEIYNRMMEWLTGRLAKNENTSRIVYTDEEKGLIVGTGDEWIVFSSSALSLDRTKINYFASIIALPEKCILEIEKIRFSYRDGKEKYTAEEWITDKYALNKAKTKLVRGLAKWRRKTVDFVDELCLSAAEALSTSTETAPVEEKVEEKKAIPATPLVPATPAAPTTSAEYKVIAPSKLSADAIQTGAGKLVIVIGNEPFNMTMMTANSGGSLGKVNDKPVVFSILSPDQPYEQMENAEKYTIRFYPTGKDEPSVILECKKLPSPAAMDGMPRTYVGEIIKATIK